MTNVNELFTKLTKSEVTSVVAKEPVCGCVFRATTITSADDKFHFRVNIITVIDGNTDTKEIIANRGLTRCLLELAVHAAESVDLS